MVIDFCIISVVFTAKPSPSKIKALSLWKNWQQETETATRAISAPYYSWNFIPLFPLEDQTKEWQTFITFMSAALIATAGVAASSAVSAVI